MINVKDIFMKHENLILNLSQIVDKLFLFSRIPGKHPIKKYAVQRMTMILFTNPYKLMFVNSILCYKCVKTPIAKEFTIKKCNFEHVYTRQLKTPINKKCYFQ